MKTFILDKSVRHILFLWLGWAILLLGFPWVARARFDILRPDFILPWTSSEPQTQTETLPDQPYLNNPLLPNQVAWDSEYYLSIATVGYDDPAMRMISPSPYSPAELLGHEPVSQNYAFFPLYPLTMRMVRAPLLVFGQDPIATSILAGVLVSLLGALVAMFALFDLTREAFGESGGLRAAFYLIVFPTGFFLAMVHTEGLFVGLAFGSLALLQRKRWVWAAMLAACATLTRAVGICLFLPLAWALAEGIRREKPGLRPIPWKWIGRGLLASAPLVAYGIWRIALGANFDFVESVFFGRGFLQPDSIVGWIEAAKIVSSGGKYQGPWVFPLGVTLQHQLYYAFEFLVTIFAVLACLLTMRKYPGLSLFGLAVLAISFLSGNAGGAQGMPRYALGVPSIYILLAGWGKNELFDRIWSIASILLMGLLVLVFAFNFWVG